MNLVKLPGGLGTFREFLDMLDEKRTKGYDKPIILFNYEKYYTPLLNFFTKAYEDNMISKGDLKMFDVVSDVKSICKGDRSFNNMKFCNNIFIISINIFIIIFN